MARRGPQTSQIESAALEEAAAGSTAPDAERASVRLVKPRKVARKVSSRQALKKGERTRATILRVAEKVFARKGYEQATLREIAKLADIQQPGIYNYFSGKRDLYERVLDNATEPLIAALDAIGALPEADQLVAETRLNDLLMENRNIPTLLVRAFLSSNPTERRVAMDWVNRFMAHLPGHKLDASDGQRFHKQLLKEMGLFNVWLGYFWTAPIIEMISQRKISDSDLFLTQKQLLIDITRIE